MSGGRPGPGRIGGRWWRRAGLALLAILLLTAIPAGLGLYRCYQDGRRPGPERQVHDVTQLITLDVDRVVRPRSTAELQELLARHEGPISFGGGRFSMGGQIGTEGTLFIDLREMDEVLELDVAARTIRVEAGITWRKIQEAIDRHDLSIKIMQSYANFTVGGSLSVNAHGRYVGEGPVVHSVRALDLILADGQRVRTSRTENPELFFAAIGGYGAVGAIAEVELQLVDNVAVERSVERMDRAAFPDWFAGFQRDAGSAVFFNADLYPPHYDDLVAITFSETDRPVTVPDRLQTPGSSTAMDRFTYWWVSEGPLGKEMRQKVVDRMRLQGRPVVWRNYEASYDARGLEPRSRDKSTYVLQEYFVPLERFESFAAKMSAILRQHDANVVNVSIRHASADPDTLLTWAPTEVFAFVLYYKQGTSAGERAAVGEWTQALIEAVIEEEGQYYLPYQIWATDAQFHAAYPRARELFALKQRVDPTYKLRNSLWDRYLPAYPEPTQAPEAATAPLARANELIEAPDPAMEARDPQNEPLQVADLGASAPDSPSEPLEVAELDASGPGAALSSGPPRAAQVARPPLDPELEAQVRRELAQNEGYLRPEDQTFLTLPEWYIVYSADELGAHLKNGKAGDFPWLDSICQFCQLYGAVSGAIEGRYPSNLRYHGMIWVIGASYIVEYGVRAIWEGTVGRAVAALSSGGQGLDSFHAELSTEYGAFIHHTPWYAFPWGTWRRALKEVEADRSLRGLERRMVIWTELFAKGTWASMLGWATGTAYGEQPSVVEAWVRPGELPPDQVEGVEIVEDLGAAGLRITVPRYEPFTEAVPALVDHGVAFVEIAGGRTLLLQVIADSSWDRAELWGDVIARWPILTEPGRDRIALEVAVGRLHEVLPALRDEPLTVEHLYDY